MEHQYIDLNISGIRYLGLMEGRLPIKYIYFFSVMLLKYNGTLFVKNILCLVMLVVFMNLISTALKYCDFLQWL